MREKGVGCVPDLLFLAGSGRSVGHFLFQAGRGSFISFQDLFSASFFPFSSFSVFDFYLCVCFIFLKGWKTKVTIPRLLLGWLNESGGCLVILHTDFLLVTIRNSAHTHSGEKEKGGGQRWIHVKFYAHGQDFYCLGSDFGIAGKKMTLCFRMENA